jgi:hypothetical protein
VLRVGVVCCRCSHSVAVDEVRPRPAADRERWKKAEKERGADSEDASRKFLRKKRDSNLD